MNNRNKIFEVELVGRFEKSFYVLATNPTEAYELLRADLDAKDYGFSKDRELKSVTLLAEEYDYPDAPGRLLIQRPIADKSGRY